MPTIYVTNETEESAVAVTIEEEPEVRQRETFRDGSSACYSDAVTKVDNFNGQSFTLLARFVFPPLANKPTAIYR